MNVLSWDCQDDGSTVIVRCSGKLRHHVDGSTGTRKGGISLIDLGTDVSAIASAVAYVKNAIQITSYVDPGKDIVPADAGGIEITYIGGGYIGGDHGTEIDGAGTSDDVIGGEDQLSCRVADLGEVPGIGGLKHVIAYHIARTGDGAIDDTASDRSNGDRLRGTGIDGRDRQLHGKSSIEDIPLSIPEGAGKGHYTSLRRS